MVLISKCIVFALLFQVYIRDQSFDPLQFYAFGRPCPIVCTKQNEGSTHSQSSNLADHASFNEVRCSKGHHWLHKKTIADVVEALVGAFIVDSGFKAAASFLRWIGIQVDFEASQVSNVCIASTSYMQLRARMDIGALEKLLGHQFLHKGLLLQAFVHPSYNQHGAGCYQVCTASFLLLVLSNRHSSLLNDLMVWTRDWSFLEMLCWIT